VTMLGILLAVDDGLLEVVPGQDATRAVEGPRMTAVDYRGDLGIASAPGAGAWVHSGDAWAQAWEGDASFCRVDPQGTLWVGSHGAKLYRSTDRGASWEELEGLQNVVRHRRMVSPPGHKQPYIAGVVFPKEGMVIGIAGGSAWFTRDGGSSWLQRSEGLDPMLHAMTEHPEQADRLFATADSGVYRSDDGGFSWVQSLGGLDRSWGGAIAVLPGSPDVLLLAAARHAPGAEGALFRSPNGGVTWSRIMFEGEAVGAASESDRGAGGGDEWPRIPCVTRLWDSEDTAFAAAGDKVWASHDTGRNWMPLATGLPAANAIAAAF
jgi:photosystem II stability/assembly factor-like uncharacterized protein